MKINCVVHSGGVFLKVFILKALVEKLYLDNGWLKSQYEHILTTSSEKPRPFVRGGKRYRIPKNIVALAFTNSGKVVGVCCIFSWRIMFYVKPRYRCKGVGVKLYRAILDEFPIVQYYHTNPSLMKHADTPSVKFLLKLGIVLSHIPQKGMIPDNIGLDGRFINDE
jgi:GNAT superfamily N-acetyltransferase